MSLDKLTLPVEEPDDNAKGIKNTFDYTLIWMKIWIPGRYFG